MAIETNHSLSVDCVILGFNGTELKVLLVQSKELERRCKLPGGMILENETLPDAAQRVLSKMTGLKGIYLKQTSIYSDPNRVEVDDLKWINRNHGVECRRVVTVGYYALLKLSHATIRHTTSNGAHWSSVENAVDLMMDHSQIIKDTLKILKIEIVNSPIAFELLPKQFTIRELQNLYSAVLGVEIDKRNFRKKILGSGLLTATGKKEMGVAHKPAEYFTFNYSAYKKSLRGRLKLAYL
ncbi:MAG: NUDIX domain-containing protein [Rikenellaceae bacterium]